MTVTISTTQSSGGLINVNWALAGQTQTPSSVIKIIYTDTLFGTPGDNDIKTVIVPPTTADASGNQVLTRSYTLTTLNVGYTYHIAAQIDGIASPSSSVKAITVPAKPAFTTIPRDQCFAVKLNGLTSNSISDGFSSLTKLEVLVAGPTGLSVYTYDASASGINLYDDTIQIPQSANLVNNANYEVACILYNGIGTSPNSETANVVPKNTPDPLTVNKVLSMGSLSWASVKNLDTASITGGIQVLANWPGDKDTLSSTGIPITKVKVIGKYKTYDPSGVLVNDTSKADYQAEYDTSGNLSILENNTYNSNSYVFSFTIPSSAAPAGTVMEAYVIFSNSNGYPSENGVSGGLALAAALPSALSFAYDIKTTAVDLHQNGALNLNGLYADASLNNTLSISYTVDSSTNITQLGLTRFATVLDASLNDTGLKKYSLTGLTNGTTYNISLRATATDPYTGIRFYSAATTAPIIPTTIPLPPKEVGIYAWHADRTPVTDPSGNPAIKLVFKALQKNKANMGGINGSALLDSQISYVLYIDSQPALGSPPISQPSNINTEMSFVIPVALGTGRSCYVRTYVLNTQKTTMLNSRTLPTVSSGTVISTDSSPPQITNSETWMPPATGMTVTRHPTNPASAVVNWTKQPASNGTITGTGLATTRSIYNRLVVLDASNGTFVSQSNPLIPYSNAAQTFTLAGLTAGCPYVISLIAEHSYTANDLALPDGTTNPTKRFDAVTLRKNYASVGYVAASPSTVTPNVHFYGRENAIFGTWDPPSSLNGGTLSAYELGVFKMDYNSPLDLSANLFSPNILPVLSVAGADYAIVSQAYGSRALALGVGTKTAILNDTDYFCAVRTGTSVGNINLGQKAIATNTVAGADDVILSLTPPVIPLSSILSDWSGPDMVTPSIAPTQPTNLGTISQNGMVKAVFTKNTADPAITDIVIIKDGSPTIDTSIFKSHPLNINNYGGKFFVEQVYSNQSFYAQQPGGSTLVASVLAIFDGVDNGNYIFIVPGVNGITMNIDVHHAKLLPSGEVVLSAPASTAASPTSPPEISTSPVFAVSDNKLSLSWTAPTNSGGAGIVSGAGRPANSALYYETSVKNISTGVELPNSPFSSTTTSLDVGITNSPTLEYLVEQKTYYYVEGDSNRRSNSVASIVFNIVKNAAGATVSDKYYGIRVGPSPVAGTISLAPGNNLVNISYTLPPAITSYPYPVNKLNVYVDNFLIATLDASSNPSVNYSYGSVVNYTVNGLQNGAQHTFKVNPIANYNYAQSPPSSEASATPKTGIVVSSMTNPTGDTKTFSVNVNKNGSGLTGWVAIGKNTGNNAVMVVQSDPSFNYTTGGVGTPFTAPNQTATFSLVFPSIVTHVLLVAYGSESTHTFVFPAGSTEFHG